MTSTGLNNITMTNEQIKSQWLKQLSRRNPDRVRIAKTVYPPSRPTFNKWAIYIRKAVSNA